MLKHEIRGSKNGNRVVDLTPIKAIRYFCLECVAYSYDEVRECTDTLCSLYPYRLRTNPARIGVGNSKKA